MATPFLGQILCVAFNFAPQGYAFCNGQTLSIAQNTALFSLLGTFYGGDGRSTFQLPNLQSRVPVNLGQGNGLSAYNLGDTGGAETVTLNTAQLPAHTHTLEGSTATGVAATPSLELAAVPNASVKFKNLYSNGGTLVPMDAHAIGTSGQGGAHTNLQPFLALNFVIALQGIFPHAIRNGNSR